MQVVRSMVRSEEYHSQDLKERSEQEKAFLAALSRRYPGQVIDLTDSKVRLDYEIRGQFEIELKEKKQPYTWPWVQASGLLSQDDLLVFDELFIRRRMLAGNPLPWYVVFLDRSDRQDPSRWMYYAFVGMDFLWIPKVRVNRPTNTSKWHPESGEMVPTQAVKGKWLVSKRYAALASHRLSEVVDFCENHARSGWDIETNQDEGVPVTGETLPLLSFGEEIRQREPA